VAGDAGTVFARGTWRAESAIAAAALPGAAPTARPSGAMKALFVVGAGLVLGTLANTIAVTAHRTATNASTAIMTLGLSIRSSKKR
jgi:hypothetical protein